jgi:hypothetical protein
MPKSSGRSPAAISRRCSRSFAILGGGGSRRAPVRQRSPSSASSSATARCRPRTPGPRGRRGSRPSRAAGGQLRLLLHLGGGLLGGVELVADRVAPLLASSSVRPRPRRRARPERRVLRDRLVEERLGDRRVVHLAVAVAAVADQVDDHVVAEAVAVLDRQPRHPHHGVRVLAVDVEDRDRQAAATSVAKRRRV